MFLFLFSVSSYFQANLDFAARKFAASYLNFYLVQKSSNLCLADLSASTIFVLLALLLYASAITSKERLISIKNYDPLCPPSSISFRFLAPASILLSFAFKVRERFTTCESISVPVFLLYASLSASCFHLQAVYSTSLEP